MSVLQRSDEEMLVEELHRWGETSPNRDEPVISLLGGTQLTPHQIGEAMLKPGDEIRELVLDMFATSLRAGMPLATILRTFEHSMHA